MGFIRSLDPKLVTTLLTAAIVRVATELLGVAEDDPLLQGFIALAVAAVVGWLTPNAGTLARAGHGTGNPARNPQAGYGVIELVVGVLLVLILVFVLLRLV